MGISKDRVQKRICCALLSGNKIFVRIDKSARKKYSLPSFEDTYSVDGALFDKIASSGFKEKFNIDIISEDVPFMTYYITLDRSKNYVYRFVDMYIKVSLLNENYNKKQIYRIHENNKDIYIKWISIQKIHKWNFENYRVIKKIKKANFHYEIYDIEKIENKHGRIKSRQKIYKGKTDWLLLN